MNIGDVVSVTPVGATTYTPTTVVDQSTGCSGSVSGTYVVDISETPTVTNVTEDCQGSATFNVSFEINGGTGVYTVTGDAGVVVGNTFTGVPLPSGSSYTYSVTDENGCAAIVVEGSFNCCEVFAGNMTSAGLIKVCEGEDLVAQHNGLEVLANDEVLRFILYTDLTDEVGSILQVNTTPVFSFDPGTMYYDSTYHVKAVGGLLDGTGSLDFLAACLNISSNQNDGVFYRNPVAVVSGNELVCSGQPGTFGIEVQNGIGSWLVDYTDGVNTYSTVETTTPFSVTQSPLTTSTYTVIGITDNSTTCSGIGQNAATITVENPQSSFEVNNLTLDGISVFENTSTESGSALWMMPDGENYSDSPTLEFSFGELGEGDFDVCLIANAANVANCADTSCQVVTLVGQMNVFIPNSFTPDGNEANSYFYPVIDGGSNENYSFLVFDRWGGLVFESNDISIGWNGSINNNGTSVPTGSYSYRVRVTSEKSGETEVFSGHITLLK